MPEVNDYDEEYNQYTVNYNAALSKVVGALFKKVKEQDLLIKQLLNK